MGWKKECNLTRRNDDKQTRVIKRTGVERKGKAISSRLWSP